MSYPAGCNQLGDEVVNVDVAHLGGEGLGGKCGEINAALKRQTWFGVELAEGLVGDCEGWRVRGLITARGDKADDRGVPEEGAV